MSKYRVCPECDGEGKVDNPAFSNGFTSSELHEAGPEFCEDYAKGVYDVKCPLCKGRRVATNQEIKEYRQRWEDDAIYRQEMRFCYGPDY